MVRWDYQASLKKPKLSHIFVSSPMICCFQVATGTDKKAHIRPTRVLAVVTYTNGASSKDPKRSCTGETLERSVG